MKDKSFLAKKKGLGGYDIKVLVVRHQFSRFDDCERLIRYSYSQVLSDLEFKYLLGSHQWVK